MSPLVTMLTGDSKLDGTGATCCCSTEVTTQPVLFAGVSTSTDTSPSTLCLASPTQVLSDAGVTQAMPAGPSGVSASSVPLEGQLPVSVAPTTVYFETKQEPAGEVMSVMPGGNMVSVLPGNDVLSVTPGLMQSLMLCQSQGGCPAEVTETLQQMTAQQQISRAAVNTTLQVPSAVTVDSPAPSSLGPDAATVTSTVLEPAPPAQLPSDGTLTAAIQSGIPVTIDPSSLTGPVAINQVFVPIYSNTDKGPMIELVPIKANPAPAPTPTPQSLPQVSQ